MWVLLIKFDMGHVLDFHHRVGVNIPRRMPDVFPHPTHHDQTVINAWAPDRMHMMFGPQFGLKLGQFCIFLSNYWADQGFGLRNIMGYFLNWANIVGKSNNFPNYALHGPLNYEYVSLLLGTLFGKSYLHNYTLRYLLWILESLMFFS